MMYDIDTLQHPYFEYVKIKVFVGHEYQITDKSNFATLIQ